MQQIISANEISYSIKEHAGRIMKPQVLGEAGPRRKLIINYLQESFDHQC